MKRRDFLKSTAAVAGSMAAAPAIWSPAKAQSRQETLLSLSESGPNNLDVHGLGTNRPGYEVSWNCYDRLLSHAAKTLPNGVQSYDRDKYAPELAEDWNITPTSTHVQAAQERDVPRRRAGHGQGRQMVVRPCGHRRRLPDLPDEGRLAGKAGAVRRRRRSHVPDRPDPQGQPDGARHRRRGSGDLQLRASEEAGQRKGPVGARIHQVQHGGRRRLQGHALAARHRGRVRAQRCVEIRRAAQGAARHLAHGAVGGQPPRADRTRRCRHLVRSAEQGFRRAQAGAARSTSCRRRSPTASSTSA